MVPGTVNSPPLCLSARKAVHVAFREVPAFEVRDNAALRIMRRGRVAQPGVLVLVGILLVGRAA